MNKNFRVSIPSCYQKIPWCLGTTAIYRGSVKPNTKENYPRDVHILESIIQAVLFGGLEQECIAFGTRNEEDLDRDVNPGNFLIFFKNSDWHIILIKQVITTIMTKVTSLMKWDKIFRNGSRKTFWRLTPLQNDNFSKCAIWGTG